MQSRRGWVGGGFMKVEETIHGYLRTLFGIMKWWRPLNLMWKGGDRSNPFWNKLQYLLFLSTSHTISYHLIPSYTIKTFDLFFKSFEISTTKKYKHFAAVVVILKLHREEKAEKNKANSTDTNFPFE